VRAILYAIRNFRSRAMFRAMRRYSRGAVLDVGGGDFFLTALSRQIPFESWTTLEPSTRDLPRIDDPRYKLVEGDGCNMDFTGETFDTVFCVQVVEHVFEPLRMAVEIHRVLRSGGHAVLLIPQTSTLHLAPRHYYNFTRYRSEEMARSADFEILELTPLGGRWSTTASHMAYFFLQAAGLKGMIVPGYRRPLLYYLLLPLMLVWAAISIPICLLLSLGDLAEEANNHLLVLRKP
jgi:SAM-dependent methyltransferase